MLEIPVNKYRLTITIDGNSHEEIEAELHSLAHGGYLIDSGYGARDSFDCVGGKSARRLEHTNPDQTPENYPLELDAWWQARKAERSLNRTDKG